MAAFFDTLTPESLDAIGFVDAPQDPFGEVQGLEAIAGVCCHMFASPHAPRFEIMGRVLQGQDCFLTWNFFFCFQNIQHHRAAAPCAAARTWLDARGRTATHRDYGDVAEEMCEKIPGLGALMRWLKKRAST